MSDSQLIKLTGLVLNKTSYGEANQFIDIFTKEQGKVTVIAKGVLRPNAKLRAYLEPNYLLSIELSGRSKIPILTAVEVIDTIQLSSLEMIEAISLIIRLLSNYSIHQHPQPELWQALVDIYQNFNNTNLNLIQIYFKSKLLDQSGSLPNLDINKIPQKLLFDVINVDTIALLKLFDTKSLSMYDKRFEGWLDQLIIQLL
ncbi:DNA repair protein RecO [Candidatus Saccharibacteria bacterium]|nr:DNA repair protein RecO [Candidatus Saccharibacteria bacterium]